MIVKGFIKKGAYFDSVTLMTVGKEVSAMDGVTDAAVVMGTAENRAILSASGLLTPEFESASDTDLLIGVNARDEETAEAAIARTEELLASAGSRRDDTGDYQPQSIRGAIDILPGANLALISVAGRYAGAEASSAIDAGLHVMLFSDNVSLETEIELKRRASEKGLLMMGPDCGTAILNGIPLAFANVVNRGDIGIVAASGTGLQEVSCIVSNEGGGISQAIGTGGRDVKKEVGGIMFLQALRALAEDDATRVIVLVSKPPHAEVLAKIRKEMHAIDKPVISIFLGAEAHGPDEASTLEEAALLAVARSAGGEPDSVRERIRLRDETITRSARGVAKRLQQGRCRLRGLFSGGTFAAEAQILLDGMIPDIHANAPTGNTRKLRDSLKSEKNTIVDLGEDEFTVGRPHPMIDYTLRNARIKEETEDPETAVILLDVVLGYGSHPDPAAELRGVIANACKSVAVVCSITGTEGDPQKRSVVERMLKDEGAVVMPSNAAASLLAGRIIQVLEEK